MVLFIISCRRGWINEFGEQKVQHTFNPAITALQAVMRGILRFKEKLHNFHSWI
jgi:hypothetical protein